MTSMLSRSLLVTLLMASGAHASTDASFQRVECRGSKGQVLFDGVMLTPEAPKLVGTRTMIPYEGMIFAKNVIGVPRPSLEKMAGIVLPECQGPYALIYTLESKTGVLSCDSADIEDLGANVSDRDLLQSLALTPHELACAVILSRQQKQVFTGR